MEPRGVKRRMLFTRSAMDPSCQHTCRQHPQEVMKREHADVPHQSLVSARSEVRQGSPVVSNAQHLLRKNMKMNWKSRLTLTATNTHHDVLRLLLRDVVAFPWRGPGWVAGGVDMCQAGVLRRCHRLEEACAQAIKPDWVL